MDSRQRYTAASHLLKSINWERDWVHFGTGKEIDFALVSQLINDFLEDENLHIILSRNDSGTFKRLDSHRKIQAIIGESNFQIWNEDMSKVIQVDAIGVLNRGERS